jgi:hypothetical protein
VAVEANQMVEKFDVGLDADLTRSNHRQAWIRVRDKLYRVLRGMSYFPTDEVPNVSFHASASSHTVGPSTSTRVQGTYRTR